MSEIRTGIKLTADSSGVTAGFASAEKAVTGFSDKVDDASKKSKQLGGGVTDVSKAVKDLVSAVAGWQLGRMAIAAADDMTVLQSRLKLVTTSTGELTYVQGRLFDIAQQSRVNFTELGATYAQIARATADLGISQDRLLNVTTTIGQAMAISGGSAESMKAALVQLSQGLASGTLRGDELNSVLEQTPRLAQAIAQGMGVSLGQLRALGQDGKLTALSVIESLEKAAPALRREFDQVTPTISQSFTTLGNSAKLFVEQLDRASGAGSVLKGGTGALNAVLDGLTDRLKAVNAAGADSADTLDTFTSAGHVLAEVLKVIVVLGANVGYTIKGIATEIGVLAAQGKAILSGDFAGAAAIHAAAMEDAERSRLRIDKFSETVMGSGRAPAPPPAVAKESFLASERADAAKAAAALPFPDAKSLEEVRKYSKMVLDVQREAYDQSVDVAKSYQNRIKLAATDPERVALAKEMSARLISIDRDAKQEMKSIAEKGAADAKQLSEAQFAYRKAGLEQSAALERQDLDLRSRSNEQFYKLGLVDVDEYYRRKSTLELQALDITERLTKAELAQAKAVAARATKQDDRLQAQARAIGLEKDLIELATKRAAVVAEPIDQRALRLKTEQDQVRDGVRNDYAQSRDKGYDLAAQMREETRKMGIDAIKDPYERSRAQLADELRLRKEMIDAVIDPDAREKATIEFNDFEVAKNRELAERMKPGFQQLLDSWSDTSRLMRETYNQAMDTMLTTGEDEFVRSGGNLVSTAKSIAKQLEAEFLRLAYRKFIASSVSDFAGSILNTVVGAFGGGDTSQLATGDFARMDRAQARASGGAYGPGLVLRGEKGPELSWENAGGYVFNASQTKDILSGSGSTGANVQVTLNITNTSGAQVTKTAQRTGQNGGVEIDLLIGAVADAIADDVNAGAGPLSRAMEHRYGMKAEVS